MIPLILIGLALADDTRTPEQALAELQALIEQVEYLEPADDAAEPTEDGGAVEAPAEDEPPAEPQPEPAEE